MAKKQTVIIHVQLKNNKVIEYTARTLGYVTDLEFQAIIKHKPTAQKLLTSPTKRLSEIDVASLIGKRLVFAVKTKEANEEYKTLLVTDKIAKDSWSDMGQMLLDFEEGQAAESINIYEE